MCTASALAGVPQLSSPPRVCVHCWRMNSAMLVQLTMWSCCRVKGRQPSLSLQQGARKERRLFDKEAENHHAEMLLLSQLAAKCLRWCICRFPSSVAPQVAEAACCLLDGALKAANFMQMKVRACSSVGCITTTTATTTKPYLRSSSVNDRGRYRSGIRIVK